MEKTMERFQIEARIAHIIIDQPDFIKNTLDRVSHKMIELIHENENKLSHFPKEHHFFTELYASSRFGRIGNEVKNDVPKEMLKKYMTLLREPLGDLPLVMHLHTLFYQHILPIIEYTPQEDKSFSPSQLNLLTAINTDNLVKQRLKSTFYLYKTEADRGRKEKKNEENIRTRELTPQITSYHNKWTYRLSYQPAISQFEENHTSEYHTKMKDTSLPFIAGASGHTGILLRGFLQLQPFEIEEIKSYLLGMAAFMISGGMHSWHEIMHVAQAAGVPYQEGNYWDMLPRTCQENCLFKQLQREFPQLMISTASAHSAHVDFADRLLQKLVQVANTNRSARLCGN